MFPFYWMNSGKVVVVKVTLGQEILIVQLTEDTILYNFYPCRVDHSVSAVSLFHTG